MVRCYPISPLLWGSCWASCSLAASHSSAHSCLSSLPQRLHPISMCLPFLPPCLLCLSLFSVWSLKGPHYCPSCSPWGPWTGVGEEQKSWLEGCAIPVGGATSRSWAQVSVRLGISLVGASLLSSAPPCTVELQRPPGRLAVPRRPDRQTRM